MGLDDLQDRLGALDDAFKKASASDGFEKFMPEPGDYFTLFREVSFFEAKSTGAAFLRIDLEILQEADYQGRCIEMVYCLEPHLVAPGQPAKPQEKIEQQLGFLKRDLKRLGVDTDAEDFTLAQVRPGSPIWDDLLNKVVDVQVRRSKTINPNTGEPYVNAYIQGVSGATLGDLGVQHVPGLPDVPADDDMPWEDEPTDDVDLDTAGAASEGDEIRF